MMNSMKRRSGFTLIEVLLVVALLAVLATTAVLVYGRVQEGFNQDAAKQMVTETARAVDLYKVNMNTLPTTEEGLAALCQPPEDEAAKAKWRGPYLKDGKIPVDPWGQELKYERPEAGLGEATGPAYKVWSTGPDKTDQTDDDIKSWNDATEQ
jgi:general secretion pathway protein G